MILQMCNMIFLKDSWLIIWVTIQICRLFWYTWNMYRGHLVCFSRTMAKIINVSAICLHFLWNIEKLFSYYRTGCLNEVEGFMVTVRFKCAAKKTVHAHTQNCTNSLFCSSKFIELMHRLDNLNSQLCFSKQMQMTHYLRSMSHTVLFFFPSL
jgi:hypothetical protein